MKNNQLVFTRFLYEKEEVKRSFLECLLKNKNYKEVLFWISEYYYSEYFQNCWEFIREIYYDFYEFHNPKVKYFIEKKYTDWKTDNKPKKEKINYVLDVIKNLYYLKSSCYTFLYRKFYETLKYK